MNKSKKNQDKNSLIVLIIGLIFTLVVVINLDNINGVLLNENNNDVLQEEKEKEIIPARYQCFYGPTIDPFYNYIKSEYIIFEFDDEGNVESIKSEEKYQATTLNDYNYMISLISINSANISYDEKNYIVTILDNENNKFPRDYKSLNKYLSENHYTCSKE